MILAITILGHLYIQVCGPGTSGLRPQAWLLSHLGSWPRAVFLEAFPCDPDMPGVMGVFGPKAADKPKHDEAHPTESPAHGGENKAKSCGGGDAEPLLYRDPRARGLHLSVRSGEQCSEGPGLHENDGAI